MKWQCTECDIVKDSIEQFDCRDRNHKYLNIMDENETKKLEAEQKRNNKHAFQLKRNDSQITKEILDHKIQVLRPQTFLSQTNWRMILIYLPTKEETIKGHGDKESITHNFLNSAFFVISKPKNTIGSRRQILPFDHPYLTDKFRIDILPNWNDVRWEISNLKSWENESALSDPTKLYELLDSTTRRYIEFAGESEYVKFVLWNIGTYCFELFDSFPYNDYTGTKRAGKSKSLEFQKLVCYNAVMSADITSSATFRMIEGLGATMLFDETEQFKNQRNDQAQQVRTLLLQGFLKNQFAVRSEGKEKGGFTPVPYNLYSPKSLAHINSLDDVLEDRCIPQVNKRALDPKIRNTWPTEKDQSFQEIRNLSYRLFLDYADEIYDLQEEARSLLSVSGRELQLWTPIISLALFFERHGISGLVNKIKENVKQSSEDRQILDEQESRDLRVLRFLDDVGIRLAKDTEIIKGNPEGWIPVNALYNDLKMRCEDYEINPEYFTRSTLTQTLKRFGFKQTKKEAGISWLITKDSVSEVKRRMDYGICEDSEKGSLDLTSFTSEDSETSVLGTKSENSQNLKTGESSASSVLSQPITHKTEQTEGIEVPEHEVSDQNQSQIEVKTEVLNMAELTKTSANFRSSANSGRLCICSCGAKFHENSVGNLGKIKDFHEKTLGHRVKFDAEVDI